ncbi:Hsp20/alpha crystallin family protein [Ideonella sp. A 288]|uniref:Hsp20/alpha crystallin family protein n=1 Tax=Ideonella sp. A 288 TaxID=1962181 RepID=UPI000B4B9538|nr:Hsp20/alpha crystallin family protein [Ideonella sp. A 288]
MTSQAVTQTGRPDARDDARPEPALLPPVDVIEDATGITLYADLPGVPRDRLNVRVESDTLLIDADMVLSAPPDMQPSHAEVQRTHYRRAFTLSRELDPDQVRAELAQGVLRVRIPKARHAQPRRIEVQAG